MLSGMKELRICLKRVDYVVLDAKYISMPSTSSSSSKPGKASKNGTSIHQCVICKKTSRTRDLLQVHIRTHTKEKPFKCNTCNSSFPSRTQLKTHEATHEVNRPRPFPCEYCTKRFCTKAILKQHLRTHGSKKFKCPICAKLFLDKGLVMAHLPIHTLEKPYSCPICEFRCPFNTNMKTHERRPHTNRCSHCDLRFVTNYQLNIHMQNHGGGPLRYKCEICQATFSKKGGLKTHSWKHTTKFRCDFCNKCFMNSGRLARHKLTHFNDKKFLCTLCYKDFECADSLKVHMGSMHADAATFKCSGCPQTFTQEITANEHVTQASVDDSEVHSISITYKQLSFKCKHCNVRASVKSELEKHMEVHAKPDQYNCDFCEKVFSKSCGLLAHLRRHTGEKPFACDAKNCEWRFVSAAALRAHQETHSTNRKLYRCTLCKSDKEYILPTYRLHMNRKHRTRPLESCEYENCKWAFITKCELSRHVKIVHLREKPHKCGFCDKAYSTKCDLRSHLASHTGERLKPHACESCPMKFFKKYLLGRHVRTVHNREQRYFCTFCEKGFFDKTGLADHIKTHTKEKSEKCDECDKRFATKGSLRNHIKTHSQEKSGKCDECDRVFPTKLGLRNHIYAKHLHKRRSRKAGPSAS